MLAISQVAYDMFEQSSIHEYCESLRHMLMAQGTAPLVLLDGSSSVRVLTDFVLRLRHTGIGHYDGIESFAPQCASLEAFWDPSSGPDLRTWLIGEGNGSQMMVRLDWLLESES